MSSFKDITGKKFNYLTVIEFIGKDSKNQALWRCKCDCGNETILPTTKIKCGRTKSCGCLVKEINSKRFKGKRSFHETHGGSSERLYYVWRGMINRCENQKLNTYPLYGGRGIKVCSEWRKNYEAFRDYAYMNGYYEHSGKEKLTIDRIDPNGDYCPENCRFVSMKVQNNNRRNNLRLTYAGETKTAIQWAEEYGINPGTFYSRISRGWSIERALEVVAV